MFTRNLNHSSFRGDQFKLCFFICICQVLFRKGSKKGEGKHTWKADSRRTVFEGKKVLHVFMITVGSDFYGRSLEYM